MRNKTLLCLEMPRIRNKQPGALSISEPLNIRFCNGPWCQVTPVGPAAGYLLLSVVRLAATSYGQRKGEPIFQRRLLRQRLRTLRLHQLHRPGRRDFGRLSAGPISPKLSFSCLGFGLVGPAESGAIDPHAVQDDAKLSCQGHARLFAPRGLATASAQIFKAEARIARVSITLAAS